MILGCHNVIMYNQSTFVLGYLLLYGYDVTGRAYLLRVLGLLVSMMVCMLGLLQRTKKNALTGVVFRICSVNLT